MKREDIFRFLSDISSSLFIGENEETVKTPEIRLADEVKKAHQDWLKAQKYFECVTDPDLVDHAIFAEEAARKKYIYLLKKAKEQGIYSGKL
ncbi:MAG TPA: DUF2508 family protein [Thermoanaerobacterales bacterium]|nr:DUF2508 family protein [Thermoanaerobacterales bacterium]